MSGNEREHEIFHTQPPLPHSGNPAPGDVRLCPQNKISRQCDRHPPVSPASRGGSKTRPRTRPPASSLPPPESRQRSEMSGNKREHEIYAPNRHSRTGGNPTSGNARLRPLADEYCDQWEESVAQDETPPTPSGLFEKLPGKSTLRQYFPAIYNYLNDCRWSPCQPHPNGILALLVPQALWVRNLRSPRRDLISRSRQETPSDLENRLWSFGRRCPEMAGKLKVCRLNIRPPLGRVAPDPVRRQAGPFQSL